MAILTLKGMEHGDIPLQAGSKAASQQSAPARTDAPTDAAAAAAGNTSDQASDASNVNNDTAQTDDSEATEELDSRSQIVKDAMDAAAKDVPEYLRKIEQQSQSWTLESAPEETKDEKTDRNILLSWLKSLVKDPFWVRSDVDAKETESAAASSSQGTKLSAKAEQRAAQEAEQQLLQDATVAEQRYR